MKVRAQIGMVLNLDKCIGCHTCSVTCKNVWTSRPGMEYAWFNNVETKPGIGYPKDWENQKRWKGGWERRANGKIMPKLGSRWRLLANIFANPSSFPIPPMLWTSSRPSRRPRCIWRSFWTSTGTLKAS